MGIATAASDLVTTLLMRARDKIVEVLFPTRRV
jgi:hypothetical protein